MRRLIFMLATGLALGGCGSTLPARKARALHDPSISLPEDRIAHDWQPNSKLFRIAVIDFVDQTDNYAGAVEDMFADVLTTEFFRTERFTLYDREQLRRKNVSGSVAQQVPGHTGQVAPQGGGNPAGTTGPNLSLASASGQAQYSTTKLPSIRYNDETQVEEQVAKLSGEVDGIFLGFITNAEIAPDNQSGVYTIDYRIVKRVYEGHDASHATDTAAGPRGARGSTLVIYADSDRVGFNGNPFNAASGPNQMRVPVTLNRDDLKRIAEKVRKSLPDLKSPRFASGRVTDVGGTTVTINLGSKDIKPGLSFFVISEEDETTGVYRYKGQFVVRDTFATASRASLSEVCDPSMMRDIRVNDRILLK